MERSLTLPGHPSLQPMVVSASSIHRVVTSKDLNKLAKQIHKERIKRWETRQLKKLFPQPKTAPFDLLYSPDHSDNDDFEEIIQPKPLKIQKLESGYQYHTGDGKSGPVVIRTEYRNDYADSYDKEEEEEEEKEKKEKEKKEEEEEEKEREEKEEEEEKAAKEEEENEEEEVEKEEQLEHMMQAKQPVHDTLPSDEPDLIDVSPKPVYVPNSQPIHLQRSEVKVQEKSALQLYQEVTSDAKEVIGKSDRGFIAKMTDPEEIIVAQPDGLVVLTDDSEGVIEIKCPSSAQSETMDMAVKEKKVKFLVPVTTLDGKTEYKLKRSDKFYHQVQAEIYAGQVHKIKFCDFVTYLKNTQEISVERIFPDSEWLKTNIPKVREFCEIYDELLESSDEFELSDELGSSDEQAK